MELERLSRRGIRLVYENGWDVCYVTMWDGWKLENVEVFFGFFDMNNFFISVVSCFYSSINITIIN